MNSKKRNQQSGQMTVEMVLILIALMGIVGFASETLKEQKVLQQFISVPWKMVSNMMESGVWEKNQEEAQEQHPGHWRRMYGNDGDPPL